jgi:hypothetical protein
VRRLKILVFPTFGNPVRSAVFRLLTLGILPNAALLFLSNQNPLTLALIHLLIFRRIH